MGARAAAGLDPAQFSNHASALDVVIRETVDHYVQEHESHPWLCAALGERWPGRYETLVNRACSGYPGSDRRRSEHFVREYIAEDLSILFAKEIRVPTVLGPQLWPQQWATESSVLHNPIGRDCESKPQENVA